MCLYKPEALPMLSSLSSLLTKHWQSWSSRAIRLWPIQEEVITQRQEHVFQPHHRFKWGWKQKRSKKSRRHPSFKVLPEQPWCSADYYLCRRLNRVHMARVLKLWRQQQNILKEINNGRHHQQGPCMHHHKPLPPTRIVPQCADRKHTIPPN